MRASILALVLSGLAGLCPAQPQRVRLLGHVPIDSITAIYAGRFVSSDIDDILVVQNLGTVRLSVDPTRDMTRFPGNWDRVPGRLCGMARLSLLRLTGERFTCVWSGGMMLESAVPEARLAANAWAVTDVDSDGRQELLLFNSGSCTVVSFGPDSIRTHSLDMDGAWVTDATACDLDNDSVPEVVTLELSPLDSLLSGRMLRAYHVTDSGITPVSQYTGGVDWGPDKELRLTGSCRLEEHWGVLPILAGTSRSPKPSTYAALVQIGDSLSLTPNPFPWREWFSKEEVLPAGRLSLFNVEDTLVAYGYFVPGYGAASRHVSFAALQDGEWRLLELTDAAQNVSGPVCRFTLAGTPGWLELRDDVFRFYPGEIFIWR